GCEHIMAALGQVPHKLRPYEPGAPDDDDPHGFSVSPDRNRCRRCASRLPVRSEEVLAATLNCPSGSLGYSSKEVPFGMGCSNQALRYYQWAETFTSCPGQGAEALGEGVPTCSSRLDTTCSTRNAGSSPIAWKSCPAGRRSSTCCCISSGTATASLARTTCCGRYGAAESSRNRRSPVTSTRFARPSATPARSSAWSGRSPATGSASSARSARSGKRDCPELQRSSNTPPANRGSRRPCSSPRTNTRLPDCRCDNS